MSEVKEVVAFETADGARWRTREQAASRAEQIERCAAIERRIGLRPTPSGTDYANGGGYVQQPAGSRKALRAALEELGAHRDSDGPVGKLLHRLWRIDDQDREWGQPYYADHPGQGKQVALAPEAP